MKKFFTFLVAFLMAVGAFVSCNGLTDDPTKVVPVAELALGEVGSNSADFLLKTQHIAEYAYVCLPANDKPAIDENVIFATGTAEKCGDGEQKFTVTGLEPLNQYKLYVAMKLSSGGFLGDVKTVAFTTKDYVETLTLVNTTDDGFTLHVKMPQEVLDRKQVLRYNVANLVMYNYNKTGWAAPLDADVLEANGQKFLDKSATLTYNDENINELDENGNEIIDEMTGEPVRNHDPFVPGEPLVFLAGEFGWGEATYGWGEGWYKPMFDAEGYYAALGGGNMGGGGMLLSDNPVKESDYWTGYFGKMDFQTQAPTKLDATFDIQCEAKATKAKLKVTPGKGIKQYCMLILDHATYAGMLLPLLNDKTEHLQWFTTSFFAAMQLGAQSWTEPVEMELSDMFYITADSEYHVLLTGLGDELGKSQCFQHYKFTTPQKSLPAPVVEVKAINNPSGKESPWEVWFNIKAPNKDVVSAKYAANYEREWASALKQMSYSDIVSQGNSFTDADVARMNSAEGLNVKFDSMDDATTILAVVGMNEEDTPSDVDSKDSKSVAKARSIRRPDATRVESELFSSLEGEWTATYKVARRNYSANKWEEVAEPIKTKVTIAGGVSYPATLPDYVYSLYPDMTKSEVENLYTEFKHEADEYNSKVRGQNCLVCLGFTPDLKAQNPFELFTSKDYNGYNNESLFYDFGPKWYLQIAADGTVSVPVNINTMFPASAWKNKVYYLVAMGEKGYAGVGENNTDLHFPVTVSSDKNTITVKPFTDQSNMTYYPNLVSMMGNYAYLLSENKTVSEITLTRGWSDTSAPASATVRKAGNVKFDAANGQEFCPAVRALKKTPIVSAAPYKKVQMQVLTQDSFKKGLKEYFGTRSVR